jgi:hypothetical protein
MLGHRRRRLLENFRQSIDGQFSVAQREHDAHPRSVGQHAEDLDGEFNELAVWLSPANLLICIHTQILSQLSDSIRQRKFHGGPLVLDDGEHDSVAYGPILEESVITQHTILLRTESRDGGSRLVIVPVRPELDGDAVQLLECPCQEKEFCGRVDTGSLRGSAEPRGANLQTTVGRIEVAVRGHANGATTRTVDDCPGGHATLFLKCETSFDLISHPGRRRDVGVPGSPQVIRFHCDRKVVAVLRTKRLQSDTSVLEHRSGSESHASTIGPGRIRTRVRSLRSLHPWCLRDEGQEQVGSCLCSVGVADAHTKARRFLRERLIGKQPLDRRANLVLRRP